MKYSAPVFVCIVFLVLSACGVAFAAELSGEIVSVDVENNSFVLKSGSGTDGFTCEASALIKQVRVGAKLIVHYKEKDGKKTATKVTPMKKRVSTGC